MAATDALLTVPTVRSTLTCTPVTSHTTARCEAVIRATPIRARWGSTWRSTGRRPQPTTAMTLQPAAPWANTSTTTIPLCPTAMSTHRRRRRHGLSLHDKAVPSRRRFRQRRRRRSQRPSSRHCPSRRTLSQDWHILISLMPLRTWVNGTFAKVPPVCPPHPAMNTRPWAVWDI